MASHFGHKCYPLKPWYEFCTGIKERKTGAGTENLHVVSLTCQPVNS